MSNRNQDGTFKTGERSANPEGRKPKELGDSGEFKLSGRTRRAIFVMLEAKSKLGGPNGARAARLLLEYSASRRATKADTITLHLSESDARL